MRHLFLLISLSLISTKLLAVGPVFEIKAQAPMSVKNVEIGDYEIEDYSMVSWYLYTPVPLFNLGDYTVLTDITMQSGRMIFTEEFPDSASFENRAYTAIGIGAFPIEEKGNFQIFGFYRRFSGMLFTEGEGANEYNLGMRLNKSIFAGLTSSAKYPFYFGLRFRMYKNFNRLLPYFIQYFEFGPHTIVFDVPTTITYQYSFWLYHVVGGGILLDDVMISPYSLSDGKRGWISDSFGTNIYLNYTYFITSDLSISLRTGLRNEGAKYVNDDGSIDLKYTNRL